MKIELPTQVRLGLSLKILLENPLYDRSFVNSSRTHSYTIGAEKLALAASEGKLQLVMRNQVDQGDEQTPGVNKRNLLTGETAAPAPEPGSLKSEQPKSESKPVRRVSVAPKPAATAPAPQPTPRASVEMIEGAKKRSVEFP